MRLLVVLGLALIAVDGSAQLSPTPTATRFRAMVTPMDQRNALAVPLLQASEKQAAALSDVDRAIVLYRIAGGWMPLDRARSTDLYRQAFLATLQVEGTFRPALQEMILDEGIPVSSATVLELAPRADKDAQQKLYRAVLMYALTSGDTRLAAKAFQSAADNQAITGRMASTVLANLPAAERAEAFRTMIKLDAQQPASRGSWAFSGLVSQFYDSLPAQDVLAAINTILQRAADVDSRHSSSGQGNMSSGPNSFSYSSETDFQLLAVVPALQKLEPARAVALLQAHPDAAKWLAKYPQGLESFDQNHSFHGGNVVRPSASIPKDLLTFGNATASQISLLQTDYGLEFTRADFPAYIQPTGSGFFESFTDHKSPEYAAYKAVVDASHPDVLAAVADVPVLRKVPSECSGPSGNWCSYVDTYPQAGLIGSLADHWTYAGKEENARAALQALPIALEKIPPQQRCSLLADAADLYLRMGDGASAYTAVHTGLSAAAQATAEEDTAYKQPVAQLLRPSADCYHMLISAGVNADFDSLRKVVDSLQNPALRAFATAMLARSLLGVPLRRELLVYPNGGYVFQAGQVYSSNTF